MEIHFCDLCNESVPQSDLEQGIAWRRGNRVVCGTCERSMSEPGRGPLPARSQALAGTSGGTVALAVANLQATASAPAQASPAPLGQLRPPMVAHSSGGAWMFGVVALLFSAGTAAVVLERVDASRSAWQTAELGLSSEQQALREDQAVLQRSFEGQLAAQAQRLVEERQAQFAGLTGSLSQLQAELARLQQNIAQVGSELRELRDAEQEARAIGEERLAGIGSTLGELGAQQGFHTDRLIELEERLHALAQGGLIGSLSQPGPTAPGVPSWQPLLADLSHSQASVRLDALYALEKPKDLGVVPYVVPMLKDVDLFVRMCAARVLEDLNAKDAVPALIDALEDTEPVVTESAMFALQKITGQDFGFEPNAAPPERAKKVKVWRDWWKKEGENFLNGGN